MAISEGGLTKTGVTLVSVGVIVPSCASAPTYYGTLTGTPCPTPSKSKGKGKTYFIQLGSESLLLSY